jgi:peptidoglycan/xylan/chitin deacetylase (PgdA/CDA1 family)
MGASASTTAGGPKRDFVGYGSRIPKAVWPNGARVAVQVILAYEEGSEYAVSNGDDRNEGLGELAGYVMDPQYRDLCVESVYEYGSRAGVWRLLRLLDEYQIKASAYVCGMALERNPEAARAIADAGHEPCSHGYRWSEHWRMTRDEEREHIQRAIETIEKYCGERPRGWYCRYGASVNTRELLVEEGGFVYDSDAYNDDLPYFVDVNGKQHLVVPYNALPQNDIRFIMAGGYAAPSHFVETTKRAIDELRREGEAGYPKLISIGLHCRWAGQPARVGAVREIFEHALEGGDVWFARGIDIAEWWLANHESFER